MIITGSNGFIGGRLMHICLEAEVSTIPVPEPIKRTIRFDCRDGVMVHLGAEPGIPQSIEDPIGCFEANTSATVEYLSLAVDNRLDRFLFASSQAVSGTPSTPYAASKTASEAWCWAYLQTYGLHALSMRFSNVYGPNSDHKTSVVAQMCRDALTKGELTVHGSGINQKRDFIHVDDVCAAVLAAAYSENPVVGCADICTGIMTDIHTVAEIIAGQTGASICNVKAREGEPPAERVPPTDALDWVAEIDLETGINETVAYFRGRLN